MSIKIGTKIKSTDNGKVATVVDIQFDRSPFTDTGYEVAIYVDFGIGAQPVAEGSFFNSIKHGVWEII